MAICKTCRKTMPAYDQAANRRECSRCLWAKRKRVPCASCGQPTGYVVGDVRAGADPQCRLCRSEPTAPCGTVSAYGRGCRCAECRAAKAAAMRAYAAAYRERTGRGLSGNYRKPTTARHGNAVPRRVRLAIYERDGWVCQLCGEPVDRTLHPNDRLAASLDHVECQSWVLIPDHSPDNLRLVHRACNSRRRNGDDREVMSPRVPVRVRRDRRPARDVAESA